MEELILEALFQDFKQREVLEVSPFGDIFFKEDDLKGGEVYSICQIMSPTRAKNNPIQKGEFMFLIQIVAFDELTFQKFLKAGTKTLFKRSTEELRYSHDALVDRFGLKQKLKKRLGKLGRDYIYGYCTLDGHNSDNPLAEKVELNDYHKRVMHFLKRSSRKIYSDIWELNSEDDFGPATQKLYYGYGFELPQRIFTCHNLKSLAVANQTIKDLYPGILKLKNLNELSLSNVSFIPPDLVNNLHKLPYLVSLILSRDGDYYSTPIDGLPPKLEQIKSLRYLDFSGNKYPQWSSVIKLTGLKTLNLSNTGLSRISSRIKYLNQLEELDLSNNLITELPESLVTLKRLRVLKLSNNPLVKLPSWLCKMKQLQVLDLEGANLSEIPENLADLNNLNKLNLKKNQFKNLPVTLKQVPNKVLLLEQKNKALFNKKIQNKLSEIPKGDCLFKADLNFKLMVVNQLMYVDEVLLPKFNVRNFVKKHQTRKIDIEEEGYNIIPEVANYFKNLPIPLELLVDIVDLLPDGGDEIYGQLTPLWDGEDDRYDVMSIEDIKYLPNLKTTNTMNFSSKLVAQLKEMNIEVIEY